MPARLGALLLVFVVAGAPAALTACGIVCAVRDSHASRDGSPSAAHACHGTQPVAGPTIDAGVQICGHGEELPAAAAQVNPAPVVVAIVTPPVIASPHRGAHPAHFVVSSPPGHSRQSVPLRI